MSRFRKSPALGIALLATIIPLMTACTGGFGFGFGGGEPDPEVTEAIESALDPASDGEAVALDVLFPSGQSTLTSEAENLVDQAARAISGSATGGTIYVVGHTDDVGSARSNQTLSEQRADSVASRLRGELGSGFDIRPSGKGESEPVAEGTSSEARAANRRVELSFDIAPDQRTTETPAPSATAG